MVACMQARWLQRFNRTLALVERQILASRVQGATRLPLPDAPEVWCHRCGATRTAPGVISCRQCVGVRLERERTVRLATYDSSWRDAILRVKHSADRPLARALGKLLAQQLLREAHAESIGVARAIIVPVPMPFARRIERGIDHTFEISKGISEVTGTPVDCCLTHHPGPVQAELAESTRRHRLRRIEWRRNSAPLSGVEVVFLVDDVLTTGSTLLQAATAIRTMAPSATIVALVVAVADKRRNA